MSRKIFLKIKRQDNPDSDNYWEEFIVDVKGPMNLLEVLKMIQANPVTSDGGKTSPVCFEACCNEGLCGACAMIINGKVEMACKTEATGLKQPIILEPMKKFPVIRDLWVDRTKIFDALKRVKAWNEIDGYYDTGYIPNAEMNRETMAAFAECNACGACLEACPQYNERSPYIGAHALGQVHYFNNNTVGKANDAARLDAISGLGGVADCGNAQNCVMVCPKKIPLTEAISRIGWATTVRTIRRFFF